MCLVLCVNRGRQYRKTAKLLQHALKEVLQYKSRADQARAPLTRVDAGNSKSAAQQFAQIAGPRVAAECTAEWSNA